MKQTIILILLVFQISACWKFDLPEINPLQTGGGLMVDEYLPLLTVSNDADTIIQVDTATYVQIGDTVVVDMRFKMATYANPGITNQNQVWISVPIATGYDVSVQAWGTWTANQYDIPVQTATYDSGVISATVSQGGYMRIQFELKRDIVPPFQYLDVPENHFEFRLNFNYIL